MARTSQRGLRPQPDRKDAKTQRRKECIEFFAPSRLCVFADKKACRDASCGERIGEQGRNRWIVAHGDDNWKLLHDAGAFELVQSRAPSHRKLLAIEGHSLDRDDGFVLCSLLSAGKLCRVSSA